MAPTAVALLQAVLSRLHALAVSPEESVPRTQGARMAVRVLGRVLFRDGRSGPAARARGGSPPRHPPIVVLPPPAGCPPRHSRLWLPLRRAAILAARLRRL